MLSDGWPMTPRLLTVSWRNVAGYDGREHLVRHGSGKTLCGVLIPAGHHPMIAKAAGPETCVHCFRKLKKGAMALEEGK
jgi:hypothetical protein